MPFLNMDDNRDLQGLPSLYYKQVIDEIAAAHNYLKYQLTVKEGSAKGENFFGELFKIKITGTTEENKDATEHWILKIAPDNETFRQEVPVHRYYRREVNAYTNILPVLHGLQKDLLPEDKFEFAKCHIASYEEFNELLVMDDLNIEGYAVYDRLKGMDYEHMKLSVQNLARFHATSFVLISRDPEHFKNISKEVCQEMDYGNNFGKFIEENKRQMLALIEDPKLRERLSNYTSDMEDKIKMFLNPSFSEPYNVLCHGDCWTSNLLFKYENGIPKSVKMVDWQVIRLASPIIDLSYIMFTSTDEKLRADHFQDILDLYYETLKDNITKMGCDINDCYPRKHFEDHLRKILPFGLLISITLCPVILGDRDHTPDLAKAYDQFKDEDQALITFSKTPTERLKGVVNDFIKYDLI